MIFMRFETKVAKVQNKGMTSENNPDGLFGRITSAKLAKYIGKTIVVEIIE